MGPRGDDGADFALFAAFLGAPLLVFIGIAFFAVARRVLSSTTGSQCQSSVADDKVMAELKREAARQGRTMSELVEMALRLLLRSRRRQEALPPLPAFHSGGTLVDVANREALYRAMEKGR